MTDKEAEPVARVLRERLLDELCDGAHWEGRLAPSALATAVAAYALAWVDGPGDRDRFERGMRWLCEHVNGDGSWGDTPISKGNLSTTLLGWSALSAMASPDAGVARALRGAEAWIAREAGDLTPDAVAGKLLRNYGEDRTFSTPILTMCALAGRLGPAPGCWDYVPQLPFELAILPHRFYSTVGLSVVSYALPALIAIGLVRQRSGRRRGSGLVPHLLRWAATRPVLSRLRRLQPANGGFLEASPLTGFVVMSLVAAGWREDEVVARSAAWLRSSQNTDGGWAIDSNLATWLTTLSVRALGRHLPRGRRSAILNWLLRQQYRRVHPYTRAAPGGWAWTDLPGGVPDADDTAGALLAIRQLGQDGDPAVVDAGTAGLVWLLGLQNRDGGFPTFCRGWGALPFDRSCPDITAHVIEAFVDWCPEVSARLREKLLRALLRGVEYLRTSQREDGAWVPLWFGNEAATNAENPVYGTARVLASLARVARARTAGVEGLVNRGERWLTAARNRDGSWGGDRGLPGTIEETGLAVRALKAVGGNGSAAAKGMSWLTGRVDAMDRPAPIGLYFASLWYYEALYPLIFSVGALTDAEPEPSAS